MGGQHENRSSPFPPFKFILRFYLIYFCRLCKFFSAVGHVVDLLILSLFNDDILITELILHRKWVNRGHK